MLPDGTAGTVYTKTYFPRTDLAEDYGCTVVSIACEPDDLLGYENGIFARGKIFKDNFAINMERINAGDVISVIANYTQKKWERPANIEVFSGNDGRQTALFESGCGIRVQGASSRRFSQKSFNIYFRKDYGKKEMDLDLI
ncbi:MAG: spore coat protein CotH, partial [Firmicutes bacterium]|nr:spore coat protein CotH [Bacillota bacterium]